MGLNAKALTGASVLVSINNAPVGAAQCVRMVSKREVREALPLAATAADTLLTGPAAHTIELTRLQMEGLEDAMDFYSLSGFTLETAFPNRRIVYSGCEWVELEETAKPDEIVLDKAVIAACSRAIFPVEVRKEAHK